MVLKLSEKCNYNLISVDLPRIRSIYFSLCVNYFAKPLFGETIRLNVTATKASFSDGNATLTNQPRQKKKKLVILTNYPRKKKKNK